MMQDSRFGQVRLRAFGTYNLRIIDVARFFREYAGTFPILTIFEFEAQIRELLHRSVFQRLRLQKIFPISMSKLHRKSRHFLKHLD